MEKIERILSESKAVLTEGHFVYASGLHGDAYVNKDAVYSNVFHMEDIGEMLASKCPPPGVVLGPAVGGALLAQWVAQGFSVKDIVDMYTIPAVYADKAGDDFVIKRGYDKLIAGKEVLVVEDILNTGGSAKKTVAAAQKCGAEVIGVGAICNRGGVTAEDLGVPTLHSLLNITMTTYPSDECPLCKQGVPVNTDVGHGKQFLADQENHRTRLNAEHLIKGGMPSFRLHPSIGDDD